MKKVGCALGMAFGPMTSRAQPELGAQPR